MSNNNRFRIAADIPNSTRRFLLNRFPPKFDCIHCTTITHAYLVNPDYPVPSQQKVSVYGHHLGDGHEALLVTVGGKMFKPDGSRYFIALSVQDGDEPYRASEIDSDSIIILDVPIMLNGVIFKRFPLWKRESLKAA